MVAAGLKGVFLKWLIDEKFGAVHHRLLFIESNPIPVKMALHLMGKFGTDIRPPLSVMTEQNAARLKEELQRLKLC